MGTGDGDGAGDTYTRREREHFAYKLSRLFVLNNINMFWGYRAAIVAAVAMLLLSNHEVEGMFVGHRVARSRSPSVLSTVKTDGFYPFPSPFISSSSQSTLSPSPMSSTSLFAEKKDMSGGKEYSVIRCTWTTLYDHAFLLVRCARW